ncbi:MAG: ATP-grasp domain-containing protein [Bryobacteraceae bacterium]|nr:ATP-grasp domain-containing protein [Bryobacteraceae bacterium]
MAGKVLYLCGDRDQTAQCLAESAGRVGLEFDSIEMGWTARDCLPHMDEIRAHARARLPESGIAGLLAGDRISAICAAYAAERLGLAYHPVEAMETCAQRLLARECLKASGLTVAPAFLVSTQAGFEDALHRTAFPCVLKPVRFTGGQGVMRADSPDEFREVYNRLRLITGEERREFILVEEYVEGDEFVFHGYAVSGWLHALALLDKPSGTRGPAFQDSILTSPSRHPRNVTAELMRTAELAASAMRLDNGPVTVEMRWDGHRAFVLEINPFLPPLPVCRALSPKGRNAVGEAMLLASAGLAAPAFQTHHAAGVGYIALPEAGVFDGIEGMEQALSVEGLDEVIPFMEAGEAGVPPPAGNQRAAAVMARAATPDAAEQAVRQALSLLTVKMSPVMQAGAAG